jgi:tRNA (guanine-N7-)-methyltransferase
VQTQFVALAARKLAPGGILHAATDWPDYADQIGRVCAENADLEKAESGFAPRPATKFETRGKRLGHPIYDLYFRRG